MMRRSGRRVFVSVVAAVRKIRDDDYRHIQPKEQIFAEPPACDILPRIAAT